MYKPLFTNRFEKQIKRFPKKEQDKILEKIDGILLNPRLRSVKLQSTSPAIYRFRVGDYRVFFVVDDRMKIIKITDVRRRTTQTYQ
jgi:mRNA-degrading endonuclease RelE of RelBE toxin-antitoxin system